MPVANSAPQIVGLSNQSVNEDTAATVGFTVRDTETAAGSLKVTAGSSNPALVSSVVVSGSDTNRTVTLVPVANQSGTAQITVTVSDGN